MTHTDCFCSLSCFWEMYRKTYKENQDLEIHNKFLTKQLAEISKESLQKIEELISENNSLKQKLEISQYTEDEGNWFLRGYGDK